MPQVRLVRFAAGCEGLACVEARGKYCAVAVQSGLSFSLRAKRACILRASDKVLLNGKPVLAHRPKLSNLYRWAAARLPRRGPRMRHVLSISFRHAVRSACVQILDRRMAAVNACLLELDTGDFEGLRDTADQRQLTTAGSVALPWHSGCTCTSRSSELADETSCQPSLQPQLPPLVATTFWSDLATRGSLFQYCCRDG